MTEVLLHGCCGRMGRTVAEMISREADLTITAGVDAMGEAYGDFPVYHSLEEVKEAAQVVIDFSTAAAVPALIEFCRAKSLALVLCTTGLDESAEALLKEASKDIPVLRSANMTLGVNLLMKVLGEVAPILAKAGFDIEVVEKHHRRKIDAPSGTALALADAANAALESPYEYVYDRSGRRIPRPQAEIGISAVRGGSIVGDHDVIFAGDDEVITFSHRAYSRAVFARGAVSAAAFLAGRAPGYYDMQDVIALGGEKA